jgi:acyl dehydratase
VLILCGRLVVVLRETVMAPGEMPLTNIPFDELQIGQWAACTRIATDTDIQLGAVYSGDRNPAHVSEEYVTASLYKSQFKSRIVHGLWILGAVSGILAMKLPGLGTIFLNESVSYRHPVYIGDEVTVTLTVASKRSDKPWATLDILAVNQNGKKLLVGTAEVLCPTEKIIFPRLAQLPVVIEHDAAEIATGYR